MGARNRWRRAIIISVALNISFICSGGILTAGFLKTDSVQPFIEMDLVSDDSSLKSVESAQGQVNINPVAQLAGASTATVLAPVAAQTIASLSVDEVSITDDAEYSIVPAKALDLSARGSTSVNNNVRGNPTSNVTDNDGQSSEKPSGGILRPQILSQVHPTYPEAARQAGITGTVFLKVRILENGRAGDVSVKQSSGNNLLDESAVTAVYKWLFTPAKEKNTGRAVACYTTVPVVFRFD